jgi:hypothetical protein
MPQLIAQYVTLAGGLMISDKPAAVELRLLKQITAPLRVALLGSLWHPVRRAEALSKLPEEMARLIGEPNGEAQYDLPI